SILVGGAIGRHGFGLIRYVGKSSWEPTATPPGSGSGADLGVGDRVAKTGVASLVRSPSGRGYSMTGPDGFVVVFGDAAFYGSTGAIRLNQPIVGMAATPTGRGYWLVASDGGIFSFGDAAFYGSTGEGQ
ncbi:MAG: hypothetical protein ACRDV9_09310, partial [Acidimicrobiia bacterium]